MKPRAPLPLQPARTAAAPRPAPLSHLAQLVKTVLNDELLKDIWVEASIVSLNQHSSGHWYLTLKEGDVSMPATVWKSSAIRLKAPAIGSVVHLHGRIDFYTANSKLQFIIDDISEIGTDLRALELERLMAQYAALTRKRPMVPFPRRIGVATSKTGAALQDIIATLQQRFPCVELVLAHCAVQGPGAPAEIEAALELLYAESLDVIIVARGGGSADDLSCFNSEIVAKAVLRSPVPVISGVGHEVDTTLIDVVADFRAATPTFAATKATPNRADLLERVANLSYTMQLRLETSVNERVMRVDDASARLLRAAPAQRINTMLQQLTYANQRLRRGMQTIMTQRSLQLERVADRLDALDPAAVLERGYAIVRSADGHIVRSATEPTPAAQLTIQFADGVIAVTTAGEHR